jgi:hydrogenase nickel incorporation protein HypB
MCGICGCADTWRPGSVRAMTSCSRAEAPASTTRIRLEADLLQKNREHGAHNRRLFHERSLCVLNLVSSPGSGKTSLLERTIRESGLAERMLVIQGDQATDRDAERILAAGARAIQINTGTGCHLDAVMVHEAFLTLDPASGSLLAIENVGNLVCPALFDLGETVRIAVISTTEGADKPLKYPHMFRSSDLVLVNKVDLTPYVDFDIEECVTYLRQVNPNAPIMQVSARRGDGLSEWYAWLRTLLVEAGGSAREQNREHVEMSRDSTPGATS